MLDAHTNFHQQWWTLSSSIHRQNSKLFSTHLLNTSIVCCEWINGRTTKSAATKRIKSFSKLKSKRKIEKKKTKKENIKPHKSINKVTRATNKAFPIDNRTRMASFRLLCLMLRWCQFIIFLSFFVHFSFSFLCSFCFSYFSSSHYCSFDSQRNQTFSVARAHDYRNKSTRNGKSRVHKVKSKHLVFSSLCAWTTRRDALNVERQIRAHSFSFGESCCGARSFSHQSLLLLIFNSSTGLWLVWWLPTYTTLCCCDLGYVPIIALSRRRFSSFRGRRCFFLNFFFSRHRANTRAYFASRQCCRRNDKQQFIAKGKFRWNSKWKKHHDRRCIGNNFSDFISL